MTAAEPVADVRLAPRGQTVALLALALGGFTIGTTEFATMGILPDIAADLLGGTGPDQIARAGILVTAYAVGVVVGAPLITVLLARVARRALVIGLMAAYVLGNLLSALAPGFGWLVLGRFVAGLPHGAFFGVGAVIGTAVVGRARRGRAVATMMTGLTVANVVGVPLSTFVGQRLGWRAAFVVVAVLGAVTVVALWRCIPRGIAPQRAGADARSEARALRNGPLWIAFVGGAIGFGGLFAVYTYVAPLVTDVAHLPATAVPLVLALFGVGMTAGTLLAGRFVDRSVLGTVLVGFVVVALALVVLGLVARTVPGMLVGLVLVAVSSQVVGVAMQTRLMDLSPAAPSLGAALSHSALNIGNANGAWVGGLVIAAGGGYVAPVWAGVGLTVLGLALLAVFGRQHVAHHADDDPAAPDDRPTAATGGDGGGAAVAQDPVGGQPRQVP